MTWSMIDAWSSMSAIQICKLRECRQNSDRPPATIQESGKLCFNLRKESGILLMLGCRFPPKFPNPRTLANGGSQSYTPAGLWQHHAGRASGLQEGSICWEPRTYDPRSPGQIELPSTEMSSDWRQNSRQIRTDSFRLLQGLRRDCSSDASSEDAAVTPTMYHLMDLPLPARPSCVRWGEGRAQQRPSVPRGPTPGIHARLDHVHPVVGRPGVAELRRVSGTTVLMYTDDAATLCSGATIGQARDRAQKAADVMAAWARRWKMLLVGSKTQTLAVS